MSSCVLVDFVAEDRTINAYISNNDKVNCDYRDTISKHHLYCGLSEQGTYIRLMLMPIKAVIYFHGIMSVQNISRIL